MYILWQFINLETYIVMRNVNFSCTCTNLDDVPNAVMIASLKPMKYLIGFLRTTIR